MKNEYKKRIDEANVYDVAKKTPLQLQPILSARLNNNILLKREDLQPVFSFKLRGAYNKMSRLSKELLKHGVISASAGNHAQGVALSAKKLKCRAVIVMPSTTPDIKVNAVRHAGAEVILHGESYADAYLHALKIEKEEGLRAGGDHVVGAHGIVRNRATLLEKNVKKVFGINILDDL